MTSLKADFPLYCLITLMLVTASCASNGEYTLNLMPLPRVYEKETLHPFSDNSPIPPGNTIIIPYATDRMPVPTGNREKYYKNQRTHLLRLGMGRIKLGKGRMTWDELKAVSLLKNRTEDFPLQVSEIKEFGVLSSSISPLATPATLSLQDPRPGRRFADIINNGLARTTNNDIYIYVHGFKVNFENPLLVASELWHYTGYRGVFIPYAWPSTTSIWAYAKDAETTAVSARTFRIFLDYLSSHTRAQKIHIVGYSAGTRLVVNTLRDIALRDKTVGKTAQETKLGNIILIGSDVNQDFFINALYEGILSTAEDISIYQSTRDQALGAASWLLSGPRLGQINSDVESDLGLVNHLKTIKNPSYHRCQFRRIRHDT